MENASNSTLNPLDKRPVILTEPGRMTGANWGTIELVEIGAGGTTLVVPATNRVKVTVIVPATVPCWMAPFCGSVAMPAPAGTVKSTVVPPEANCVAGS